MDLQQDKITVMRVTKNGQDVMETTQVVGQLVHTKDICQVLVVLQQHHAVMVVVTDSQVVLVW